jgi:hypothetical protein
MRVGTEYDGGKLDTIKVMADEVVKDFKGMEPIKNESTDIMKQDQWSHRFFI